MAALDKVYWYDLLAFFFPIHIVSIKGYGFYFTVTVLCLMFDTHLIV